MSRPGCCVILIPSSLFLSLVPVGSTNTIQKGVATRNFRHSRRRKVMMRHSNTIQQGSKCTSSKNDHPICLGIVGFYVRCVVLLYQRRFGPSDSALRDDFRPISKRAEAKCGVHDERKLKCLWLFVDCNANIMKRSD
jgi:hypothetical protein